MNIVLNLVQDESTIQFNITTKILSPLEVKVTLISNFLHIFSSEAAW